MDGGALAFFQYADDEAGPCVLGPGKTHAGNAPLQGPCVAFHKRIGLQRLFVIGS
jgi:hypothetical protein